MLFCFYCCFFFILFLFLLVVTLILVSLAPLFTFRLHLFQSPLLNWSPLVPVVVSLTVKTVSVFNFPFAMFVRCWCVLATMTKKSCMQLNIVGYSIVILLVLCAYHPRGSSSSSCSIGALQFFLACYQLVVFLWRAFSRSARATPSARSFVTWYVTWMSWLKK
mgnify:CR=1 FL=1